MKSENAECWVERAVERRGVHEFTVYSSKCGIILLPGTAPVVGRDYFYYTLASCLVPRGLHAAVCHITRNTSLALLCILDKSLLLVCNWYGLWTVSHELLDT